MFAKVNLIWNNYFKGNQIQVNEENLENDTKIIGK